MSRTIRTLSLFGALVALGAYTAPAEAQVELNARAGLAVPTFDITDAADPGFDVGGGLAYWVTDRVALRANVDFGFHPGAELDGTEGPDIDVLHFIGGVGYLITDPREPWFFSVNAGAGALSFNPDAEGADTQTYFAINAGAEVGYWVSENVALFLSPQGDIAFVDEEDLGIEGIDTAWVWPFTAGLKVKLGM